ncbi:MAG: S-layer homology domain-containing protein [Thermoanaerobacteraceae bacterium]|nr:S-layer homology domain-containing protein [Thermoanaerobacteraceae bacterium]
MRRFLLLLFLIVSLGAAVWWEPGEYGHLPDLREAHREIIPEKSPPEREPSRDRIAPELKEVTGPEPMLLNVILLSPAEKERIAKAVVAAGGSVLRGLDEEGTALRVELPAAAVTKLAGEEAVVRVEPYAPRRFLSDRAAAVVGSSPLLVPGFATSDGLSGVGQIAGVADSGLDKGDLNDLHPDFATVPGRMPKVVLLRSWAQGPLADPTGHGTHIAGILAGTGAGSGGRHPGIAPGASIYFQAITNQNGEPDPPADLAALFRPAYSAGVRVHVDGWGGGTNDYAAAAAQIDRFCFNNPDFLPVFGAGNGGPGSRTLTSEANSKNALVVGASENPRPLFGCTGPETVARLSSRGPAGDGRLKPDLVAPGVGIIAPCSRLAASGLPGYRLYTRLDGTSMAAAVAGGATILLRQYLREEEGEDALPAALLKALLINGARPLDSAAAAGFGLLDLAGTVLALKEDTFVYVVEEQGLGDKERADYEITVRDGGAPLKVTLCWTDPPALPGARQALVNDLDLVVEGPDGRRYLGNDFEKQGVPDRLNNVEQVQIPQPVPGRYRIAVVGAKVGGNPASGSHRQAYALVYGQKPNREVVERFAGAEVKLASGGTLQLPQSFTAVFNGRLVAARERAFGPGTDLYRCPGAGRIYAVGEERCLVPARFLKTETGAVVTTECQEGQDGGYLVLAPSVRARGREVLPADVPPGVRATVRINPSTQTVWKAEAGWEEKEGFLDAFTADGIRLIGGAQYQLAGTYSVARETDPAGLDVLDQVFGPPDSTMDLPSGIPVTLRLDPETHRVLRVAVRQELISGFVAEAGEDGLLLADGRKLMLFPGAQVFRGANPVTLEDLPSGEHVVGTVLAERKELLQVQANPGILYGQVLYVGAGAKTLQLQDRTGRYRLLEVAPGAGFYRGTVNLGPSAIGSGQWVRVTTDASGRVVRVDLAGETGRATDTVQDCDPERWVIEVGEARYKVSPGTMITKNGHPVGLEDIQPGEEATVAFWETAGGGLVALAVRCRTTAAAPYVEVRPPVFGKPLCGRTGATHLYLYTDDGRRFEVAVAPNGEFSCSLDWTCPAPVRLVGVNRQTGGVAGLQVELPRSPFRDTEKHWAAREIAALAAEGFLTGYPDGAFRPGSALTRVELAVLANRFGHGAAEGPVPSDAPAWAREAVRAAVYHGWMPLFPDGTFRPGAPVDRATLALVLASLPGGDGTAKEGETPPYRDWAAVPLQARDAVAALSARGIVRGRPGGVFAPLVPVTRAEAAAAFYRWRLYTSVQGGNPGIIKS